MDFVICKVHGSSNFIHSLPMSMFIRFTSLLNWWQSQQLGEEGKTLVEWRASEGGGGTGAGGGAWRTYSHDTLEERETLMRGRTLLSSDEHWEREMVVWLSTLPCDHCHLWELQGLGRGSVEQERRRIYVLYVLGIYCVLSYGFCLFLICLFLVVY